MRKAMPTVIVHNGNFEKAMRKFKKRIANDGIVQEVKERQYYEKPCDKRNRAKAAAKARWKKYLRDQKIPKSQY